MALDYLISYLPDNECDPWLSPRNWVRAISYISRGSRPHTGVKVTSKANKTTVQVRPSLRAESAVNSSKLNSQLVGEEIAGGHAFAKHVIKQGEFKDLGIKNKEQFASHIEKVISNPTSIKYLNNGCIRYWEQSTGTIVIRNPKAKDGGTAFRPKDGRQYFDDLN
ncbi:hypothetical protein [Rosenbergiella collisarenosi]|uniref:hypothetical protein n=1 Tax=Rosenbergiella collisarenosi TaxID=1544695 RepID=UPI001F4DFBC5|nr:hypothetical protein [Rosenbergiella collisarenosi]